MRNHANLCQINFKSSLSDASELVTTITIPNINRTLQLGATRSSHLDLKRASSHICDECNLHGSTFLGVTFFGGKSVDLGEDTIMLDSGEFWHRGREFSFDGGVVETWPAPSMEQFSVSAKEVP